MTMTVVVDVVAGASATIKSATVVVADEDTGAGEASQKPNIQGAVSKSQTKVVATNIGARFDAIGGEVGAVGRNTPTGGDVLDQAKQNFALNGSADSWNTSVSHSRGVAREDAARELAMMASFDSSDLMLGAAQKGKTDGVLAPQDRDALLAERPVTVWGHGSYTSLDNDRLSGNEDNRYDGDVWGYNIGLDYRFSEKLYAGVSLGYSETDLTTTYNNGTYDETNWSLSPYAVYKPIEPLKLSFLAGYSMGDLDLTRNNGAVTGDTDSDMWFAGVNADYTIQPNKAIPLDLTGSVGFLAAHKTVDAYQESDGTDVAKEVSNTRQAKAGVELAYTFDAKGTSIQPFTKVDFLYDFKDATNDDAFAFDIGGGLRLGNAATGLSGAIEGATQLGRDDYKQYSISGMVAYGFSLGANGDTEASQIKPFVKSGYTQDAQEYGTGVSFIHGSGLFEADVDVSHGLSIDNETSETKAKVGATLKF
ncbi:autotransporter outer membrane beta-barrel domain-containing protein [Terasakiella pusilla]|uniref:autotransporter outer membrane beta-barrel domain-containing protein n=1 Tax=Terasakiella pusilla TaxID=64973 RepID=UPI003AA92DEA